MFPFLQYMVTQNRARSQERKRFYSVQHLKYLSKEEPKSETQRETDTGLWNHPPASGHVKQGFFLPLQNRSSLPKGGHGMMQHAQLRMHKLRSVIS